MLQVLLAALEAHAPGGDTPALHAVPAATTTPGKQPPETTEHHQRRAEAILRRAGCFREVREQTVFTLIPFLRASVACIPTYAISGSANVHQGMV